MTALTHFKTPLWQTPFHARTAAANKLHRWGPWAGYQSALCYGDTEMEYTAIRNAASVYDLCPMVKYAVRGPDAAAYLNRLTLRDAAKLAVGGVHYTVWCDDQGKMLDDGTLFRHGPDHYMICCQERHLNWLSDSALGFDVTVPETGAPAWFDLWCLPTDARNVENAHLFIDYLLRPEVIAVCTNYTGYANANKAATPLVDPAIASDPAVYPDAETLSRMYTPKPQTAEQESQLVRIWTEIKAGG